MFTNIMIPVDLSHADQLDKALSTAAGIAKQNDAKINIVGVTQSGPTEVARTPEEFADKLNAFAMECSEKYDVAFAAHTQISHDPTIDLDTTLIKAADSMDADLIVMASHVPGFAEFVFSSNAGYLASHSKISVFVVR